jgi:hypothetical protein
LGLDFTLTETPQSQDHAAMEVMVWCDQTIANLEQSDINRALEFEQMMLV